MKVKKMDIKQELKPVENAGRCLACKYFYFDPAKESSHYYETESIAQGHCIKFKKEKIGTTTMSKGCKHWKLK